MSMIFKKERHKDLARLERQINNLTKLVDINSIINSTLDIRKLLTIIMEIIKDIMETEASTLLLYEEESKDLVFKVALGEAGNELTEKYRVKIGQGIAGWVAETREPVFVNNVYDDRRFDPNYDKQTGFTTKSMLCTPLLFKGKLLGVIQAINPLHSPGFTKEDLNLFKVFANQAALAVQNAIFFSNALDEARIKSELTSAKSIHSSLIPNIDEQIRNFHIGARSISAREVGGEFHGMFHLDESTIGITLGDIHQKGIPGSIQASILYGAVKTLAYFKGKNPADLIRTLKNSLIEELSDDVISMFYGIINVQESKLQFINAGVAYPILLRNKIARYLRFGQRTLNEDLQNIQKIIVNLKPGDFFIILTDGILKVKNRSSQQLGLKRIMKFLQNEFQDPQQLIESLLDYAQNYSNDVGLRNDVSIITIKVS